MRLISIVLLALMCSFAQSQAAGASSSASSPIKWEDVWTLSFDGASLDPTKWGEKFKDRMTNIAIGIAISFFLGVPLWVMAGQALFLYGAVRISIFLSAFSALAAAGWVRRNTLWMLAGGVACYLLLFGWQWTVMSQ